jgi:hypothetical protein
MQSSLHLCTSIVEEPEEDDEVVERLDFDFEFDISIEHWPLFGSV